VDSGLVLTTGRGAQGSPLMPVTKPNAMPGSHVRTVQAKHRGESGQSDIGGMPGTTSRH
jgi:hypothetical protein